MAHTNLSNINLRNVARRYLRASVAHRATILREVVLPYLDGPGARGCRESTKLSIWADALAAATH